MAFAPKGCGPKIVDTRADLEKSMENLAKELGKTVDELTDRELDEASLRIGIPPHDWDIP